MFGSEYATNPQILLSSFSEMHATYKKKAKKVKLSTPLKIMFMIYMKIFGIPEIGFQIRSMHFEKIINEKLTHKKIHTILDAGSGIGIYSLWLAKKFPEAKIFGGDIDQEKLDFSKKFSKELNYNNVSFDFYDVTKKKQTGKRYDLIINIDVLEHIENYKQVIQNFSDSLSSKGYLYLHTPRPQQKRIFKSLQKWEHEGHVHEGYTPTDLQSALEKAGLRVLVSEQTFGFLGKLAWELNHLSFKKNLFVAGILFPFLYLLTLIDLVFKNNEGLGTAILAQKLK